MTRDFVFEELHGVFDPYAGIVQPEATRVRGWNDAREFFEALKGMGVESYLEVGSWCGASMLRAIEVFNPAWAIAVDTWLGAAEHWMDVWDPTHDLRRGPDGQPGIYDEFRRNMVGYQVAD